MRRLAIRLAAGECEAFTELYSLCGDRLHHYLSARLLSRDDASDVLQEVFLRLVRSKASFRSVENPIAYSFQVARNEAARWLARTIRKREQHRMAAADLFIESIASESRHTEWAEFLSMALIALPDEQREIVVLKIYNGFSFREIADITQTPQGTVATRYRRALAKLREIVGELS